MPDAILFSAEMIRALLDGKKTVTRRPATSPLRTCKPGDSLWVREAWRVSRGSDKVAPNLLPQTVAVLYEADNKPVGDAWGRLRPSIHMPRWMSRATLALVSVDIRTLHQIDERDALAEGVAGPDPIGAYREVWRSIHGAALAWETNPDVLRLEFRVLPGRAA